MASKYRETLLLIITSSLLSNAVEQYRGTSITWSVNQTDAEYYPSNSTSSEAKIHIKMLGHSKKSDFTVKCVNESHGGNLISRCMATQKQPIQIFFGSSVTSQPHFYNNIQPPVSCFQIDAATDLYYTYSYFTIVVPHQYFYLLRYSGCCWSSSLAAYSRSSWNIETVISLKKRQDTSATNNPPDVQHMPSVAFPESETKVIQFPVSDKDNDVIKCRWAANFTEGGGIYNARIGSLDQNACTLKVDKKSIKPGSYGVAFVVEDFLPSNQKQSLSKTYLQFLVTVTAASATKLSAMDCTLRTEINFRMVPMVANQKPVRNITSHIDPYVLPFYPSDGCNQYQVLTEPDRAVKYSDWSSFRCDMQLVGWYRFSGQAGNRLLNSCPAAMSEEKNRCGSYYQGWLQPPSHPSVSEGEVQRTVCFSPQDSCTCTYSKQIKIRNCGQYYVYFFDRVPTCNSRYCGEKSVGKQVHCSSNYMRIDFDRSYYNQSLYSSITLRSTSCKASYSSSHIFLGTVLGGCGSTTRTIPGFIVYENQIIMKAKSFDGMIVREPDQYITVACSYPSDSVISSNPFSVVPEVNSTEPGFGNFKLQLDMHGNSLYNAKYNKFPVGVRLTDNLYFETSTTARNEFVLLIDQCFSTPGNDRNHPDKRLFINERCGTRADIQFYSTTRAKQRFSIKASELLKNRTQAYIHCLVFLCHHQTTESRCKSGCTGNNLQRTARSVNSKSVIFRPSDVSQLYLVAIGAIEKEKDQPGHSMKIAPVSGISLLIMVLIEVFVLP